MRQLSKVFAILLLLSFLFITVSQVAEAQTPMPAPVPLSPVNGASLTVTTPTFTWSSVTAASLPVLYDLQVASSSAMTSLLINRTNIATNTYTLSSAEVLASGTYWWQVRARDSATPSYNYSNWSSPPWSFSIDITPQPTPTPVPTPSARSPLQGLFGVVKAVSTTALTMETRAERGETRNIDLAITSNTRIMAPPIQVASVGYIKFGERIAVLASVLEGKYTALQIVVIPGQPVKRHIQGLVMDIKDSQVTLIERNGKVLIMQLAQGVAAPAIGQFIIATVEEDPSSKELRLLAFGVSDKLLDRLEKHIGKIGDKKPKDADEERAKGKDLDRLEEILNRNAERHLETLQRVLDKAPGQAKAALSKVLDRAKERKDDIKNKVEKRKGREGPPGPPTGSASNPSKPGKSGK